MPPKRVRKSADDETVTSPAKKQKKVLPIAVEITDKRAGRRTTEYSVKYDDGKEEWMAHPSKTLIDAFESKLKAAGPEKIVRHDFSIYGSSMTYTVKWKSYPEKFASVVEEKDLDAALLEAYWRPLKFVKAILAARRDSSNTREYLVEYKQLDTLHLPNEWVCRSLVPSDLVRKFDVEADKAEEEKKTKDEHTSKWKLTREQNAEKWSEWHKQASREIVYLHTQNRHWDKCLSGAVHANNLGITEQLLTAHKEQVETQTSIPSTGGRNLFEWAVQHNNIPMLELLASSFIKVNRTPGHILSTAKHSQTPEMLDTLRQLFAFTLEDAEGFVVVAVRHGQQATFAKCYGWIVSMYEHDNIPESNTNWLRPLHLAAATATSACDLPAPLDELACNAPALGQHCTPVHIAAALNPHIAVLKALLKAGGDETIADNSGMMALHYAAVSRHGHCKELVELLLHQLAKDVPMNFSLDRLLSVASVRGNYGRPLPGLNPVCHALKANQPSNAAVFLALTDKRLVDQGATPTRGNYDERLVSVCVEEHNWQGLGLVLDRPELDGVFADDLTLTHDKLIAAIKNDNIGAFVTIAAEAFQRKKTDGSIWDHKDELVLLYCAIAEDSLPFVQLLVEHYKCRVNDVVDTANSPLRAAVAKGFFEVAAYLIHHGAWTRQRDQYGTSVLMTATRNGETECMKLLVQFGVDINSTRDEDQDLIEQLKQELVALDAMDEDDSEPPSDPNKPFEGWVCVVTGDFNVGQWGVCRWIENYGGRVGKAVSGNTTHCICGRDGVTEWGQRTGRASKKYQESTRRRLPILDENDVAKLVGKAPRKLTGAQELDREVVGSAIHDLMQFNVDNASLPSTLEYLASLAKDIYSLDEEGRTPLHCLTEYSRETPNTIAMLSTYLQLLQACQDPQPADINATNRVGMLAVVDAAMRGKWAFCDLLLDYPAIALDVHELILKKSTDLQPTDEVVEPKDDTNHKNDNNHISSHNNSNNNRNKNESNGVKEDKTKSDSDDDDDDDNGIPIRNLQSNEAPEDKVRVKNRSLLHLFIQAGKIELVKKLVQAGGNPNICSRDPARTPALCWAIAHCRDDIAAYLLGRPGINANATDENGVGVAVGMYRRGCQSFSPRSCNPSQFTADPLKQLLELTHINPSLEITVCDKSGTYLPHIVCQSASNRQLSFRFFFGPERSAQSLACRSLKGTSPFAAAIAHHQFEAASVLLDLGANVNDTLSLALGDSENRISVLRYCLSHYPVDCCVTNAILEHPNLDRSTSLLDAIAAGNMELAKRMCLDKRLVFPDSVLNMLVGSQSSTQLFESFLGSLSLDQRSRALAHADAHTNNMAPLQKAISLCKPLEMIQLICAAVTDPITLAHCNKNGQNVIHTIVIQRNFVVLDLVLARAQEIGAIGALLSATDNIANNTALHLCVCENELGGYMLNHVMFDRILKVGGDVLATNAQGKSVAWMVGSRGPVADKYIGVLKQAQGVWRDDTVGKHVAAGSEAYSKAATHDSQPNKATTTQFALLEKQRDELKKLQAKVVEEDLKTQILHTASLVVPVMESVHERDVEVLIGNGDGKDGDVFDAMLRLVKIQHKVVGKNQFAHIQILKRILPKEKELSVMTAQGKLARLQQRANMNIVYARKKPYLLVTKWGRIGSFDMNYARQREWEGQETKEYTSLKRVKEDFEAAYEERTGHNWSQRFAGKKASDSQYSFVQRHYNTSHDPALDKHDMDTSALPQDVKELMSQICDESLLWRAIREQGVCSDLLPLGVMRADVIQKAFGVLADLQEINKAKAMCTQIRGRSQAKFTDKIKALQEQATQLINLYFTLIPSLSFSNFDVATELRKLQSFMDVVEANLLMCNTRRDQTTSRLDTIYNRLFTNITQIDPNTTMHQLMEQYINNGNTKGQQYHITSLYAVDRLEDNTRFIKHIDNRAKAARDDQGERPSNMLLWHGTSGFNVLGILSKGLCIAPPEAPVSGYMFGKGLYFADTFDKSVSYCDSSRLALVCEVSLGDSHCLRHSQRITELPKTCQSTKGVGRNAPLRQGMFVTQAGIGIPLGAVSPTTPAVGNYSLNYNEYIVYDVARVRVAYLVRFTSKPATQALDANAYRVV